MSNPKVVKALREAEELASVVSEPYRVKAFEVLASEMIRGDADREPERRAGASNGAHSPDGERALPAAVNELLADLRNRPHTDRFTAVIYHSLKQGGPEALTTDEILSGYHATRMSRPSNPSDVIAKCFRKGHVTEDARREGQKTWRLTGSGERHVEQLLADTVQL
jgi:hypothetical protein